MFLLIKMTLIAGDVNISPTEIAAAVGVMIGDRGQI